MLSIAHVICTEAFAGVERHTVMLAAAQAAAGHEVAVIGGHPTWMPHQLGGSGVAWAPARSVPHAVKALARLRGIDVLHAHMSAAEVAVAASPTHRHSLAVTTRHFAAPRGTRSSRRWATTMAARRLDGQIAISEYVARHIEGPATVIHPGVLPVPARSNDRGSRGRTILMAQRLEPEKAGELGLRAFAASPLPRLGWRLQLAGGGSLTDSMRSLATDLKIAEQVTFLGFRDDVPSLMKHAGLLLATCPVEGLGLTVLEGMALGVPVVATGSGGHLETIGRDCEPALFPVGDYRAAGEWLAALALDRPRAENYGRRLHGIQRQHFTVATWQAATDAFYTSLS